MNGDYATEYATGYDVGYSRGFAKCKNDVTERIGEVLFKWITEERIIDKRCIEEIEKALKEIKK